MNGHRMRMFEGRLYLSHEFHQTNVRKTTLYSYLLKPSSMEVQQRNLGWCITYLRLESIRSFRREICHESIRLSANISSNLDVIV